MLGVCEACCLHSCSPPNLAVWLRELDLLPQTPQETGPVPPPQAPGHFLGGQSHQPGGTSPFQQASMKAQLRWTGHVTRMEDSRLPNQIRSELAHGTRRQGARQSATKTPPRTLCAPVTSLLSARSITQQMAALGGWQPTTEPKPSRKGYCRSLTSNTKPGKIKGQPSCCRSLPSVWIIIDASVHRSLVCGHIRGAMH